MSIHRHFISRQLHAHLRLLAAMAAGALTCALIPPELVHHAVARLLIGWNVSTWLYVLLAGIMMFRSTHDSMRRRARVQDEGRFLILILVILTAIASLITIMVELVVVKDTGGLQRAAHIALVGSTILGSWAFTHTMFALHYAHDFYASVAAGRDGGLDFPGTSNPDYGDFIYFACIIGTSGQTADVSFTSSATRRVGLVHSVLSFFFNTTVLALTVNIAASLL